MAPIRSLSRRWTGKAGKLIICAATLAVTAAAAIAFAPNAAHLGSATASSQVGLAANLADAGTFNAPLVLPESTGAAEPSIRTDQAGRSYVIGPAALPTGLCPAFRVSHDGSAYTYLGKPDIVGGGDCDWAIGPKQTAPGMTGTGNTISYSSLWLGSLTVGKSTDAGATFSPSNPMATQIVGNDREWMDADPKPNALGFADVFMTYHDLHTDQIQLSVSTDGGQTYVQDGGIINPQDVPAGQWAGSCLGGACIVVGTPGAGNSIGNLIAFRPKGGQLKLISIFATPEDVNDNFTGTGGQSRLYEAIGTVTDNPTGGLPVVSWRNYEIWHGPVGARYDKIFPVTAVDQAGGVYALWSDGFKNYVKYSSNGVNWGCPAGSTVPAGTNPCTVAPSVIPNPDGINATVFPWIAAGKEGIADVVFYGTTAPTPGDYGNAGDDWHTYFGQTTDKGQTWSFSTASPVIHHGGICVGGTGCAQGRTLLDFFQVAIDPTNGAATIAYASDTNDPGTPTIYYTRQCTGTSATNGTALVNDCVPPPPPPPPKPLPPMSTCPGPQVADWPDDAPNDPNSFYAGDGANMDNLDIVSASFATPNASSLQVTLRMKDFESPPPTPVNANGAEWTVFWKYNGTTYYVDVDANGAGPQQGVYFYGYGTYAGGSKTFIAAPTGTVTYGPNGGFTFTVPRSGIGNPPDGSTLTGSYATVFGTIGVAGGGLIYNRAADIAPDRDNGADYVVGQTC